MFETAVKRGLELFRDVQRERLTRSFTSDMTAQFATTGRSTVGPDGEPINIASAAPFVPNLQKDELDPGEYTIQFSVLPPPGKTPAVFAEVTWKVNGQQLRRFISVYSGATISGVAEAVHVKLQDWSGVFSSLAAGDTYKVVGTLSKGTRPTIMQPPVLTTLPAQTIEHGNPSNPLIVQVPQDSGVISVFFQVTENFGFAAPLETDIQAFFLSEGAVILGGIYPLITQGDGWIPLPPGTFEVEVFTNQAAPNNVFVTLVWGVEG